VELLRDVRLPSGGREAITDTAAAIEVTTCETCGSRAEYGYLGKSGMRYFCAEHRTGKWYADKRLAEPKAEAE
jgi:hypothetical protein